MRSEVRQPKFHNLPPCHCKNYPRPVPSPECLALLPLLELLPTPSIVPSQPSSTFLAPYLLCDEQVAAFILCIADSKTPYRRCDTSYLTSCLSCYLLTNSGTADLAVEALLHARCLPLVFGIQHIDFEYIELSPCLFLSLVVDCLPT